MTKKEKTNLPAVSKTYRSFVMPIDEDAVTLPAEIAAEIPDDDNEYYEVAQGGLPFVSIRQKDLKDERGKTIYPAGGFKYQNVDMNVPDADGAAGLIISIIADQHSRIYWKALTDERPTCKSIDGKNGAGDPGGACDFCPLAQWGGYGRPPECRQQIKLFAYDHSICSVYVVTIGRSGLKPYNTFKHLVKRNKVQGPRGLVSIPLVFCKTLVTTLYYAEPAPHFVPMFQIVDYIDLASTRMLKNVRAEYAEIFRKAAAEVNIKDDSDHAEARDTEYSELPPDDELPKFL